MRPDWTWLNCGHEAWSCTSGCQYQSFPHYHCHLETLRKPGDDPTCLFRTGSEIKFRPPYLYHQSVVSVAPYRGEWVVLLQCPMCFIKFISNKIKTASPFCSSPRAVAGAAKACGGVGKAQASAQEGGAGQGKLGSPLCASANQKPARWSGVPMLLCL